MGGEGCEGVCRAPGQFSCWSRNDPNYADLSGARPIPSAQYTLAREAVVTVIEGRQPDPTGRATHYYAISMPKAPKWTAKVTRICKIGRHIFFKDVP
ncbi:cell wall hydrolase [Pseudomonas sp. TCU-HL1]|uniref:cell wall hydrolase n=1 Tax=Pseudomonas sp. TCU-HL1 TaxID=1856685 RepID=UPI001F466E59|nr:cell wall hydrolase [Pseudomonas sp. TCU-HL1]